MLFLYILGGIVAILVILVLVAPTKYNVSRSVEINRPLGDVFDFLKYVKNQDHWSPWKKKDPNMTQTFTGEDGQIGFISHWEGNKDVGVGEQEIKSITENKSVETELRFYKPWKSVSTGYLDVHEEGDGKTKVVWGFRGANPRPFNVFMLFMNMDKAVGKDFEEGLASLKDVLENK